MKTARMYCTVRLDRPAFQWNFVSGEVEDGETPEEAAIREVGEEVGLEVAIDHRLGNRVQPVSKRHMYYYICRVGGGAVDLVDDEENVDVAWCTLDEVYEHFEELAQIPGGMYPPLFQYLDRVLVKRPARRAAISAHGLTILFARHHRPEKLRLISDDGVVSGETSK